MPGDMRAPQRKIPSFVDFDIEIEDRDGPNEDYTLSVRSPSGEVQETMKFPFGAQELESRLKDIQIAILRSATPGRLVLSPESKAVQEFGRLLFNSLMVGDVRNKYAQSQIIAADKDQGLRLKLRIKPPELAALPWEFMWDSSRADYVCLQSDTPLVRYIEVPLPVEVLSCQLPLRILGMVASPADMEPLKVAAEKKRVNDALAHLIAGGQVELVWLDGGTWQDLYEAVRSGPWHVFHFIGHGGYDRVKDEGLVLFENPDGTSYSASATQLARLLVGHKDMRLVVLNSCEGARGGREDIFSSTASILLRHGIPSVLAMQYEISDDAALEFSRYFYDALAHGIPVDAAVNGARVAVCMQLRDTLEWATPVLYMRSPDGVLFDIDQTTLPIRPPEPIKQPEPVLPPAPSRQPAPVLPPQPVAQPDLVKQPEPDRSPVPVTRTGLDTAPRNRSNKLIMMGVGAVLALVLVIGSVRAIINWFTPTPTSHPATVQPATPLPVTSQPGPTDNPLVPPLPGTTVSPTTPAPLPDTPTPDPLTLPQVQTIITYWKLFGNRNFSQAWDYLSSRFQTSQFNGSLDKYIAARKNDQYCDVSLRDPRVLTSSSDTMYVLGSVVYTIGVNCVEAPSNFVHRMTLSRSKWLIDRVIAGVVSDAKCAGLSKDLSIGKKARVTTRTDTLSVRGFPAVTDSTIKYSDEYLLDTLPPGTVVTVLDGPICGLYSGQYYWWWKVRSPRNIDGWVVDGRDTTDPVFIEPLP